MIFGLFEIFGHEVTVVDLIVGIVAVLVFAIVLILIIRDIKKHPGGVRTKVEDPEENGDGEPEPAEELSKKQKRKLNKQAKEADKLLSTTIIDDAHGPITVMNKKERKKAAKAAKGAGALTTDPIAELLGFDPYSAVETEACEITETFYDGEQETEDMRALRDKMRSGNEITQRLTVYKERLEKVKYESSKISRYLRDNGVVIASATAVGDKLQAELDALSADKKKQKANKESIANVTRELENNKKTIIDIKRSVVAKSGDDKLLKDAQNYLEAEIARTERELELVNSDIKRLNTSVGAELEQIEKDNRARMLMSKYRELKPLLVDVNSNFRAIGRADAELEIVHQRKREVRQKLDDTMNDLKTAYGAGETELTAKKVSELNKRMLALDAKEEEIIKNKENKIQEFKTAKRKANEFLDNEKYDLEDIIVAEDKVVGELEYEQLKLDYEAKKKETAARYVSAQKKYDAIVSRKVKFKKNQDTERRAYEEEIQTALQKLKQARTACEKAVNDADKVLPTVSPMSLVVSGNGVISKERLTKRAAIGVQRDIVEAERIRRDNEANAAATAEKQEAPPTNFAPPEPPINNAPVPVGSNVGNAQLRRLMEQLNALERYAISEKEQRARRRKGAADYGATTSAPNKIEKRKAQIVSLRKNLRYIDSPRAAKEFKQKLYQISISLDEDEMSDNVLSEMIRRTMEEATRLGEQSTKR